MTPSQRLQAQWRAASAKLGINFEGPFVLRASNGTSYEFAGLLPQFGPAQGMLLLASWDAPAAAAASAAGFGFSCLTPGDIDDAEDLTSYVDCLTDWGWANTDQIPPPWYGTAV
jgi:hypothetical protein